MAAIIKARSLTRRLAQTVPVTLIQDVDVEVDDLGRRGDSRNGSGWSRSLDYGGHARGVLG